MSAILLMAHRICYPTTFAEWDTMPVNQSNSLYWLDFHRTMLSGYMFLIDDFLNPRLLMFCFDFTNHKP